MLPAPWLAQHPPPNGPTGAEGDSGKAKGERKYAGASGGCLVTKEVGRAGGRQASRARRLPPKPPACLQARGPREGPAGFAPDSRKQRSAGPKEGGAPWIPSGSAPQGLARTASWRGEAWALAEPRKSLTRCHTQTWPHGAAERPSTKPAAGPTRDFSKMGY